MNGRDERENCSDVFRGRWDLGPQHMRWTHTHTHTTHPHTHTHPHTPTYAHTLLATHPTALSPSHSAAPSGYRPPASTHTNWSTGSAGSRMDTLISSSVVVPTILAFLPAHGYRIENQPRAPGQMVQGPPGVPLNPPPSRIFCCFLPPPQFDQQFP